MFVAACEAGEENIGGGDWTFLFLLRHRSGFCHSALLDGRRDVMPCTKFRMQWKKAEQRAAPRFSSEAMKILREILIKRSPNFLWGQFIFTASVVWLFIFAFPTRICGSDFFFFFFRFGYGDDTKSPRATAPSQPPPTSIAHFCFIELNYKKRRK